MFGSGPGFAGFVGTAEGDLDAHGFGHGGFGEHGLVGAAGVFGVGAVDVVGLMACHHLVA